ncbi:MAG: YdcF family protein [Alphaproteobacteria bacterium]|nr:YdcF family protein [Alphaproteobacteria bacterium]
MRNALLALLVLAALWFAGFLKYVHSIPDEEPVDLRTTDGIVVLTGGPSRLNQAVALLAAGHSGRLLISGVDARTNDPALMHTLGLDRDTDAELFACCIDVGREAQDTVGNAREIAAWANGHGFRSLRVVTADFHLPRSLLEIRRYAPDLVLVPHPVFSDTVRPARWWRSFATARLLVSEYSKLIVVWLKANVLDRIIGAPQP